MGLVWDSMARRKMALTGFAEWPESSAQPLSATARARSASSSTISSLVTTSAIEGRVVALQPDDVMAYE